MLMRGLFITGTDTDAGKTVITGALLRALHGQGLPVRAVKPVQTGVACSPNPTDSNPYADAVRYSDAVADMAVQPLAAITLRTFALAASPHLAARQQGQELDLQSLVDDIAALYAAEEAFLLLEGAGGLHVPLNGSADMLDLMQKLEIPVVVVAANRLGVLNHALLSVHALEAKNLRVAALVLSHISPAVMADSTQQAIMQDTAPCLRKRLPHIPVLEVPYCPELQQSEAAIRAVGWQKLAQELLPLAQQVMQQVSQRASQQPMQCEPKQASTRDAANLPFKANGPDTTNALNIPNTAGTPPPHAPSQALLAFDAAHIWHPYTSATRPLPVREVTHTAGNCIHVRGAGGLVDGMSSWWCAIHGYGQPKLVQALQQQAERMSHVMFGGLTHEPAVELTQSLLPLLPQGLEHLFFSDSGSVAVEVALKMALQYGRATSTQMRDVFIVPRGGYHGDTTGAMSVCDPVNGMHGLFSGFLPQQIFVERPDCPFGAYNTALADPQPDDLAHLPFDPRSMQALEAAFAQHGHRAAGCILEPVVQGAGGMWLYHPEYVRRAAALCRAYGALLIVDEIATGFGRTGKFFACQWAAVQPDILCLGKALTGGMLSLAATACSAQVAQGICADGGVFMHGPTFMGNPLACAVAKASVDLLLASPWQARIAAIEAHLRTALAPCAHLPGVAQVRVLGAIGVIECAQAVPMEKLQDFFVRQGVWLRPFGRLIYLMPPYSIRPHELKKLTTALCNALQLEMHRS